MRLKKLKVSGFKSFVDSTDIRFPANLVGVVGPNGCGKSNVIDAVRWVMGESSAKMLRGDSMSDVIFNGSATRKPVGKAFVELVFDNIDGRAEGHYAKLAEISVMRTITRDGKADYLINRSKVRRRDVLDLFRGTGLGTRSYSIIEQGMVSRIVEAKPEELRTFIEEAAGISKYKDRRRESEHRIRHTRENLERVEDICNELDKQLRRLKRQASAAERYKLLKQEKRKLSGQLAILKLDDLEQQLESQDRLTAQYENELQQKIADQRSCEADLEEMRQKQNEARDVVASVQQDVYKISAKITNLEQRIEHKKETRKHQQSEIERLQAGQDEGYQQLQADSKRKQEYDDEIKHIKIEIKAHCEKCEQVEQQLMQYESAMEEWEGRWDDFTQKAHVPAQQQEVQKSRILHLQKQLKQTADRREKLDQEFNLLQEKVEQSGIAKLRRILDEHNQKLIASEAACRDEESAIVKERERIIGLRDHLADVRTRRHEASSRLQSLREIQSAVLAGDNESLQTWLQEHGLLDDARMANRIKVEAGWERAADRLLNGFLGSICVKQIDEDLLKSLPDSSVSFIETGISDKNKPSTEIRRLVDVIECEDFDLEPLLGRVWIAESIEQAMTMRERIVDNEVLVTNEGILIGPNWVSLTSASQAETGVLVREEEMASLENEIEKFDEQFMECKQSIELAEQGLKKHESKSGQYQLQLSQLRTQKTDMDNRLVREEEWLSQSRGRVESIKNEFAELTLLETRNLSDIDNASHLMVSAAEKTDSLTTLKKQLLAERQTQQSNLTGARDTLRVRREQLHQLDLKHQRIEAACETLTESVERLSVSHQVNQNRLAELLETFQEGGDPIGELTELMTNSLQEKVEIGKRLSQANDRVAEIENKQSEFNAHHKSQEKKSSDAAEKLNQQKLNRQETRVHCDSLIEHITQECYVRDDLKADMPKHADAGEWQRQLDVTVAKIGRSGPVNLVAIDEYEEQSERKRYLDEQRSDLNEALQTLEDVIRKIDKETRERFRETFEELNKGFAEFFPKLFGGGKAELILSDDDLLIAGVRVMARPPGKRNSSIYLLSGGEKALTAVALLFALFHLHPAPFCMLDEVDAPLDDANVERYCETLRAISKLSQLVVITHNKITMEYADLLVGVTMVEPGVSRLVSVDVDEAIKLAAAS